MQQDAVTLAPQVCKRRSGKGTRRTFAAIAAPEQQKGTAQHTFSSDEAPTDILYDAVVIGSGMGGLTTAAQLASKGAKVVVLEKCASLKFTETDFTYAR